MELWYTTFDGKNIVDIKPLRAVFHNRVLRVTQLKTTRLENVFQAKINSTLNGVDFSVDYLEPGDGAVFEIYHTDENLFPFMEGTIKGLPKGIVNWGDIKPYRDESRLKIPDNLFLKMVFSSGALVIIIFFVLAFISTIFLSFSMGWTEFLAGNFFNSIIILIIPVFPLYVLYRLISDYLAEREKYPQNVND